MYDQKSLMARRRATKSRTSLHQIEILSVFSNGCLALPFRKRAIYEQMAVSNESDVIGPVIYEPWSASWTLPFGLKKDIAGISPGHHGTLPLRRSDPHLASQSRASGGKP